MNAIGVTKKTKGSLSGFVAIVTLAVLVGVFFGTTYAQTTHVNLSSGAGAPNASGFAEIRFDQTVMEGSVHVNSLPVQPFGSGRFYGVWFVRTDTGDKAFLGALIDVNNQSIIFSTGGVGKTEISATQFTTGPNAGSPITLGAAGTNLIVVLIENIINGLTPSPVGPVPGTGVAVGGTF